MGVLLMYMTTFAIRCMHGMLLYSTGAELIINLICFGLVVVILSTSHDVQSTVRLRQFSNVDDVMKLTTLACIAALVMNTSEGFKYVLIDASNNVETLAFVPAVWIL